MAIYDVPPGKHLRIFFASNHNYNASPCNSSPSLGWRMGAQKHGLLPHHQPWSFSPYSRKTNRSREGCQQKSSGLFFLPCAPKGLSVVQRERHSVLSLVLTWHHLAQSLILWTNCGSLQNLWIVWWGSSLLLLLPLVIQPCQIACSDEKPGDTPMFT